MSLSTNNINNTTGQESHTQSNSLLRLLSKDTSRPVSALRLSLNSLHRVSSLTELANTPLSLSNINTARTLSVNSLSRISSVNTSLSLSNPNTPRTLSVNSLSRVSSLSELTNRPIYLGNLNLDSTRVEQTERPRLVFPPPTCNIKKEIKFAFDLNPNITSIEQITLRPILII